MDERAPLHVLLMGNGILGLRVLEGLLGTRGCVLRGVICSPAVLTRRLHDPGVRELWAAAGAAGVPVQAFEGVNRPAFRDLLARVDAKLVLLAGWPELLAPQVLHAGPSFVNCHPSLLPAHRGSNPYAASILAGDTHTGVSFHRMDEGIDTGALLLQRSITSDSTETGGELRGRCALLARDMLPALVAALRAGASGEPQARRLPLDPPLREGDARLDLEYGLEDVCRRVRAVQPWLVPTLRLHGRFAPLTVEVDAVRPAVPGTRRSGRWIRVQDAHGVTSEVAVRAVLIGTARVPGAAGRALLPAVTRPAPAQPR